MGGAEARDGGDVKKRSPIRDRAAWERHMAARHRRRPTAAMREAYRMQVQQTLDDLVACGDAVRLPDGRYMRAFRWDDSGCAVGET